MDEPEIIGDLVAYRAAQRPEHEVIRFADVSLSYGQLDEQANRLADSLTDLGLTRGETCAVQLPNSADFVVAWIALARLGVVEVPIGTSLRGDLLAHQLATANCEVVITTMAWAERFHAIAEIVPTLRRIVVVDTTADSDTTASPPTGTLEQFRFAELVQRGSSRPPLVAIRPQDPAVILFTSGTTGPSKGVVRSPPLQHGAVDHRDRPHGLHPGRDAVQCLPAVPRERPLQHGAHRHDRRRYGRAARSVLRQQLLGRVPTTSP